MEGNNATDFLRYQDRIPRPTAAIPSCDCTNGGDAKRFKVERSVERFPRARPADDRPSYIAPPLAAILLKHQMDSLPIETNHAALCAGPRFPHVRAFFEQTLRVLQPIAVQIRVSEFPNESPSSHRLLCCRRT